MKQKANHKTVFISLLLILSLILSSVTVFAEDTVDKNGAVTYASGVTEDMASYEYWGEKAGSEIISEPARLYL